MNLQDLTPEQIRGWAEAYKLRTGRWPKRQSGAVEESPRETWANLGQALRLGLRGLRGGVSLAGLLGKTRREHSTPNTSTLSLDKILAWADAHRKVTGEWPKSRSGAIDGSEGETWVSVNRALRSGSRGLPGGSSLAALLTDSRGVRIHLHLPPLSEKEILEWADAHFKKHQKYPQLRSGMIDTANGETWSGVHAALQKGLRGLSGGSSLARLLEEKRGIRNHKSLPKFFLADILTWIDAHYERTGKWPSRSSGPVGQDQEVDWKTVDLALRTGLRGLPGGSSLFRLNKERRARSNRLS